MGPYQQTPKFLELLDTQVFSGSVQWVLLEISWNFDVSRKIIVLVSPSNPPAVIDSWWITNPAS